MREVKHCFILAGTALLVACATPPAPSTPDPAPSTIAAVTLGAPVPKPTDKFKVPIGYEKAMVNGQERYCRNDVETGSHISRTRVCYTMAQLQSLDADNQANIQRSIDSSNALGTAVGAGAPSAGPGR